MDTGFAKRSLKSLEPWLEQLQHVSDRAGAHALYDPKTPAGRIRMANLRLYLSQLLALRPRVLLVGEAPGYRGTWRTGVNFTSEKIMMGPKDRFGLYGGRDAGYALIEPDAEKLWGEASSTVVQKAFQELPCPPLVWPALPLHPHKPGNDESNRTPTPSELRRDGAPQLQRLIEAFKPEHIAAVGNIGLSTLGLLGIEAVKIRHPAHGGGPQFREGLLDLMRAA
ncbi:MAG: uracil-DNA glycosylase [Xanthomonadales bacterium]|nr:uracil-DNA glycosylase [Xanthomonadales bacterium]